MKTALSAAATWMACRSARWYLDRSSRKDTEYLGGRVRLRTLWNQGAGFGLPIGKQLLPVLSGVAMLSLLARRQEHPVATGAILGGGLSNLQERLTEGGVYDYVQFPKAPKPIRNYVYNLADFAIILGGAGLLRRRPNKRS